jgi:hypothetical protein
METVRHHVSASGNSTLRGFYGSDNVDYDPPSNSLRINVQKAKCQHVYQLADGYTDGDDERDIRDTMSHSENSYEMIRMYFAMRNWEGLDDELEEGYLDEIGRQTAQVLDQRDYTPYQLIRKYLWVLDYKASPNLGDVFMKIRQAPANLQPDEIDFILAQQPELLKRVASAALRNRSSMVEASRIVNDVIQAHATAVPPGHRVNDVVTWMYRVNYTRRICYQLELLRYDDLYNVLLEMADPAITDQRQRQACHDAVDSLHLEFAAAQGAVNFAGDNAAKSTVGRFMTARQAALDVWSPAAPPATIFNAIRNVIAPVVTSLADLKQAIIDLPDQLTASLSLPSLLGSDDDDNARALVSGAQSQGWLDRIPARVKSMAIRACLDGWTVDDDEIAILACLTAARAYDQAEVYQLEADATWEDLYDSIDGDEYDQLLDVLKTPV